TLETLPADMLPAPPPPPPNKSPRPSAADASTLSPTSTSSTSSLSNISIPPPPGTTSQTTTPASPTSPISPTPHAYRNDSSTPHVTPTLAALATANTLPPHLQGQPPLPSHLMSPHQSIEGHGDLPISIFIGTWNVGASVLDAQELSRFIPAKRYDIYVIGL